MSQLLARYASDGNSFASWVLTLQGSVSTQVERDLQYVHMHMNTSDLSELLLVRNALTRLREIAADGRYQDMAVVFYAQYERVCLRLARWGRR